MYVLPRFVAVLPFMLVLLFLVACDTLRSGASAERVGDLSPTQFGKQPLVRTLALAVEEGDESAIAAAIRAGADVNAFGAHGFRLLVWAMCRENVQGFELLLRHGASLDGEVRDLSGLPRPHRRETILGALLASRDVRFLEAALRSGLDADYIPSPPNKRTLLFMAAQRNSLPAVKTLLTAGADVNWREESGQTVLMESLFRRDYAIARFLIDYGADPMIKDNDDHDFVWGLKQWGSRGVWPEQRESFDWIVSELVRRGLLTRQDIVDADKPKTPNRGVTVIEHSPDSDAGRAILQLDQAERDFYERQRQGKISQ